MRIEKLNLITKYCDYVYRLLLGNVEGNLTADSHSLPCVLKKMKNDGKKNDEPPGWTVNLMLLYFILYFILFHIQQQNNRVSSK